MTELRLQGSGKCCRPCCPERFLFKDSTYSEWKEWLVMVTLPNPPRTISGPAPYYNSCDCTCTGIGGAYTLYHLCASGSPIEAPHGPQSCCCHHNSGVGYGDITSCVWWLCSDQVLTNALECKTRFYDDAGVTMAWKTCRSDRYFMSRAIGAPPAEFYIKFEYSCLTDKTTVTASTTIYGDRYDFPYNHFPDDCDGYVFEPGYDESDLGDPPHNWDLCFGIVDSHWSHVFDGRFSPSSFSGDLELVTSIADFGSCLHTVDQKLSFAKI